jgi:hypothetical protein
MATAAAAEIRAFRRHALRRRLDDFDGASLQKPAPLAFRLHAHTLARRYVRRQHHAAVQPRQPVAAIHQLLDRDFDSVFDCVPPFTIRSRIARAALLG